MLNDGGSRYFATLIVFINIFSLKFSEVDFYGDNSFKA